jgi:antitoxin component of MazEF toxin-antitoxin module
MSNDFEIRKINKANINSKTSKITLPKAYCDELNLAPGDTIKIRLKDKEMIISKVEL